jgi:glycosyltransferase involved in cell wall biosynthesis
LLTPELSSGGDQLFANTAREIARDHPEWHIGVVAPDYACAGLAPFFRTVIALPPGDAPGPLVRPHRTALIWWNRLRPAAAVLARAAPRLVHTTGDFFVDVLAAARTAARSGCKWTGVVHHLNPPPFRRRNDALTAAASYGLQAISLRALRRSCDRISLLNDETRAALERRGFARERLRVVGAGIDTARFRLVPAPAPGRRVLWVHRLEPTKGVGDLPRLAALLGSETTIDVVGNGPRHVRAALERVLAAAGVAERVRLHGYVDDATLVELYARANAFVSCSYEEGWGISLCEALAVGVPCAGYALPSYASVFGDLIATVPIGDVAALARRIDGILRDPGDELARARRSDGVADYSFASAGARQAAIFAELLATR